MNAQQENFAEALVNRDFVLMEDEDDAAVYEKNTREGMESVTIFIQRNVALHERWNKSGQLISNFRYDTEKPAELTQLLSLIR